MNVAELRGLEPFSDFDETELSRLAHCMQLQEFTPLYPLFHVGDPARSCFLLIKGEVTVELESEGVRQAVAVLGRGELIGLVAAIDGGTRSATCIAGPDGARIARLSYDDLERLLQQNDAMSCKLWSILLNKISQNLYEMELKWARTGGQ